MALVHARDAGEGAGDVVQELFSDVDWGAELGEIGRVGAPEIVKSPGDEIIAELFVESELALAPTTEKVVRLSFC